MTKSRFLQWINYNLRYLGSPRWDSGISPPELLDLIAITKPGRALDLGAGTGTNMATLAKSGWRVDGVEFAVLAVLSARKKMRRIGAYSKIHFRSVTDLGSLKGPYDLILDIGCFHGLSEKERRRYIINIKQLIHKDGIFLLYAFLRGDDRFPGICEQEIEHISSCFKVVERQNGLDHGERYSVWLKCQFLLG